MTYEEFINNIINSRGQWNIPDGDYFEGHHILPICLGGTGNPKKKDDNIIWLYPEEHFIAHKLLAEENPSNKSLVFAWSMMAFPKGKTKRNIEISPQDYAELRKMLSESLKTDNPFLKNGCPWNKGLTKETDDRLALMSENSKGKNTWTRGLKRTDKQKENYSKALKKRYLGHPETFKSHTKGKKCYTNGEHNIYLKNGDNIPDGYFLGGSKHKDNSKYYSMWTDERRKEWSKKTSGENNPMYGKGYKLSGGKNGKAIYNYYFDGKEFLCRKDLIDYLKQNVDQNISENAIRSIVNNTYGKRIEKKFKYIIENLSWRLKNEDKISNI